ncbi:MAG: flippase, partial [Armatimonadota bacterium]|nr:flippase [Armatimonadota bacterium]
SLSRRGVGGEVLKQSIGSDEFIVTANAERGSLQIIRNVLMNWLSFAATIVTGFFMSPFLVRHLGDSHYGVWILLGSLVGYLGLLDFGIHPSIVKRVAEFRARGDQEAINRLVTGGLAVFTVLSIVSLALTGALAIFFNDLFHTPVADNTIAILVLIVGLNFAINLPASVFIGVLRGYQRYDLDAAVTSFVILSRCVFIIWFILQGYGLLALAILTFAFDMARLVYLIHRVFRINSDIHVAREHLDWQETRQLLGYSSHFFLITLGTQLNFVTDSIVIGLFLPTASVTLYFIANRLVTYLRDLVVEMTGVLMPAISDLHASQDDTRVRELHVISTKYTLLISLPVAAILLIMGDTFIALWIGPGYQTSALILRILTIAIMAHLIGLPTASVLTGLGQHRVIARFTIAQALANLILSLLLVKPFGLRGVAMGTLISMVGFMLVTMPVYFRHYLKLPIGDYLRRSTLLPLAIQIPLLASLVFLKIYTSPASLLTFFGLVGIALIPYGVLAYTTCLSQVEKRAFSRLADKFGLKLAPRFS